MVKKKLESYVRKAVMKNLPEDLILQKMNKAGFSEKDIHQAIKSAEYKKKSIKKGPRWLYLILTLIPLIIGYIIYMNWLPISNEYFIKIKQVIDIKAFIILGFITVIIAYALSSKGTPKSKIKKSPPPDQSNLSEEFHKIERVIEKQTVDFKKPVKPQRVRLEKIIVIVVYVIVLGFAIYLIAASLFPQYLPFKTTKYTISAEDSKLFNPLSSFYIDDPSALGDKVVLDGKTVRPIVPPKKFNFVFVPKTNIPDGTTATLSLSLMFNNSNAADVYLNDKLIFPSLANYQLLIENDDDYIYVSKDVLPYTNKDLGNESNTEEFLYKNFPGANVWSDHPLEPLNIKLVDYKPETTLVKGTFRDNLKLAVYTEGDLKVDFVKQDINMYLGPDEYTINITEYKGISVYSRLVEDEGVRTKGSTGKEQPVSFTVEGLPEGIYYISFTKDAYNDASDSTVKNIKINTNKVVIVGDFLPWAPFEFYTKASLPKGIGFYYWWEGQNQVIKVNGISGKDTNLDESWIGKRYDENLTHGNYNFGVQKGYLWVYSDYVSPSQTNYFDIPVAQQDKFNSPNVLVIEREGFDNRINELRYNRSVAINNNTSKIDFRVLNPDSVYLESAELSV